MNANEAMIQSANKLKVEGIGIEAKADGFNQTATLIREMVKIKDSLELIPFAISQTYTTYNHAEDLKEEGKAYAHEEGVYEAWQEFVSDFSYWLVDQDPHTIIKHSVNEEVSIKDGVKRPTFDSELKELLFRVTTFYIRGYDEFEGNVTHVDVEMGKQNRKFTFDEFSKLFDHEQLYYMEK